ncbi:Glucose-6-phosphate isomerase,glucose-6-phosphate isomerase,Phosphoglucose isomerase [Chlamydia serpentis]|uniref:Glucose-6-phosphate isomerase n=1 Tax=Chlamydia serpentis TaxID=1967782 RepID=A0A2R8FCI1_9CHLA|nr:glucose-6-phosphate isomerase [Chlamydia serpentis]SPN74130.1 Glucose-6-phosphate isomerase,glucose-6-phosphate isomerase,Phosphoglucose isomerase [Chlamydia serpentis]
MERKNFLDCNSTKILQEFALNPIDLTSPGLLSEDRIKKFALLEEGFTFSFATERVDDAVLAALTSLAEERGLYHSMLGMQQGEVVNYIEGFPSEMRPALHTATRAWVTERSFTGQAEDIAVQSRLEAQRLKDFLEKVRDQFTTIVQIGIGGSELGPKALYRALRAYCPTDKIVHFISNIDPDNVAEVLNTIDYTKTLVVVVSKSGTTIETAVNEAFFAESFSQKGLLSKDHFIAVTCKDSPMDDTSRYFEVFHLWDSIGGRFSSTSMVGGVLLGFAYGFQVFFQLLQGASAMDQIALKSNALENLPMLSALLSIWNRNFLGYSTAAIIPYSSGLEFFPEHLQQCCMESNGKSITQNGSRVQFSTSPVIWGEPGTNAQHSFFQCLHQGTDIVPIEFIGFEKSQGGKDIFFQGSNSSEKLFANMIAQTIALACGSENPNPNRQFDGNRPSSVLVFNQLNPYTLGQLLSYYENKIAFQGFCWGINSFDQEGVSLGKTLANRVLDLIQSGDTSSFPEAANLLKLFNVKFK